jgi:hypothetical protein
MLAQELHQQRARIDLDGMLLAVDLEGHGGHDAPPELQPFGLFYIDVGLRRMRILRPRPEPVKYGIARKVSA